MAKHDKNPSSKLLDLSNEVTSETATVYMESGLQIGFLLVQDMIKILSREKEMIPKHDQTAFFALRQEKPQANIFEVKKAWCKGQKMQKMIPKRDHISLSCTRHR